MAGLIKQVDRMKSDPSNSKEGVQKLQAKLNEYKQKIKLSNQLIAKVSQAMNVQNLGQQMDGYGSIGVEMPNRDVEQMIQDYQRPDINRDLQALH